MRSHLAWLRAIGRIGLVNIGIFIFGISVFGTAWALAQSEYAAAHKNKKSTYAALAEAPEKARERKNPFEADTQAVAAGGKLFEQHCADCHGRKAGGAR